MSGTKSEKTVAPLVSVGIPTYNRPEGLRKTLDCIINQSYKKLEIIICDNASTNPVVLQVVDEYLDKDPRIIYHKQDENVGAAMNFLTVLRFGSGDFFMWAADDDKWEDFFIEAAINEFRLLPDHFIAVNCEAQYFDKSSGEKLEFFAEAEAFYNFSSISPIVRLKHVFENNYGNMVYSVFRMNALRAIESLKFVENEIPIILQLSNIGNWRVIPKIGLYKAVKRSTYNNLKWEVVGGTHPRILTTYKEFIICQIFSIRYHLKALRDIYFSINTLNLSHCETWKLYNLVGCKLFLHFLALFVGYKSPKKRPLK